MAKSNLFMPVVDEGKLNSQFLHLCESPGCLPARTMLEDVWKDFTDPDGNFVEQFQTTGFNARYFEIYLFAYLSRCGFAVDRSKASPDFLVNRKAIDVAIEATTVNPTQSLDLEREQNPELNKLNVSAEETLKYQIGELAIKMGSALLSKLTKRYWEQQHCKDKPFVVAIEAFHTEDSLGFSDAGLSQYLFGTMQSAQHSPDGTLQIYTDPITEHSGSKVIPSNFFVQPETENISAVLFTNSGTHAKFQRMGYQHGFGTARLKICRSGWAYNPDPTVRDATRFTYWMSDPITIETWGQGLVVCHNPRAKRPLPPGFFPQAVEVRLVDGVVQATYPDWHPFNSVTQTLFFEGDSQLPFDRGPIEVGGISKKDFRELSEMTGEEGDTILEDGWFSDSTYSFLGVLLHNTEIGLWKYFILGRDKLFKFRVVKESGDFVDRESARVATQHEIFEMIQLPQRLFP